jgi:hypothetical protein
MAISYVQLPCKLLESTCGAITSANMVELVTWTVIFANPYMAGIPSIVEPRIGSLTFVLDTNNIGSSPTVKFVSNGVELYGMSHIFIVAYSV